MILILTPWKKDDNSPMRRQMNMHKDVINVEYNQWRDYISEVEKVIIIASKVALEIVENIYKENIPVEVFMYWWDPVEHTISPSEVPNTWCVKYTFNKRDSLKYNLKYNPQFIALNREVCDVVEYDISFVGRVNGQLYGTRIDILDILENLCEQYQLKTFFALFYDDGKYESRKYEIEEYIPEKQYYEIEKASRAILDITEPAYNWMTLRPLEALYFQKKLITNNIDIKDEKLYHPNNVFVLGIDPLEKLKDFLKIPMYKFEDDIFYEYSFEKWLHNFVIHEAMPLS